MGEGPSVEVVADLAQIVAVAVELQKLRRRRGICRSRRIAAMQDENMASGIDALCRHFAEIEVGRQAQKIGNGLGDRRDVLRAGETGSRQPDRAYSCGGENLSSAPRLTHEAAATGACRSRIVHGVPPVRATRRPGRRPKPDGHNKAARSAATRPMKATPRDACHSLIRGHPPQERTDIASFRLTS